jgi:hypothetical protein
MLINLMALDFLQELKAKYKPDCCNRNIGDEMDCHSIKYNTMTIDPRLDHLLKTEL